MTEAQGWIKKGKDLEKAMQVEQYITPMDEDDASAEDAAMDQDQHQEDTVRAVQLDGLKLRITTKPSEETNDQGKEE